MEYVASTSMQYNLVFFQSILKSFVQFGMYRKLVFQRWYAELI